MTQGRRFATEIEAMGAAHAAYLPTAEIPFDPSFREACKQNACGYYGRCWTCPPDAGEIETLIARVMRFDHGVVFQTISPLEDSYDIEGMHDAAVAHNKLTLGVQNKWRAMLPQSIVLGAGACGVCAVCTKPEGQPCRFPEQAITSLEACGVNVSELAANCGLNYINGKDTVTYFGMLLY